MKLNSLGRLLLALIFLTFSSSALAARASLEDAQKSLAGPLSGLALETVLNNGKVPVGEENSAFIQRALDRYLQSQIIAKMPTRCQSSANLIRKDVRDYYRLQLEANQPAARKKVEQAQSLLRSFQNKDHACYSAVSAAYLLESLNIPLERRWPFYERALHQVIVAKLYLQNRLHFLGPLNRCQLGTAWLEEKVSISGQKTEKPKLFGAYFCTQRQLFIDPMRVPFNLAAAFVHELDHLLRDHRSSEMNFSSEVNRLIIDEVMATLSGAVYQLRFDNDSRQIQYRFHMHYLQVEYGQKMYAENGYLMSLWRGYTRSFGGKKDYGFDLFLKHIAQSNQYDRTIENLILRIAKGYKLEVNKTQARDLVREFKQESLGLAETANMVSEARGLFKSRSIREFIKHVDQLVTMSIAPSEVQSLRCEKFKDSVRKDDGFKGYRSFFGSSSCSHKQTGQGGVEGNRGGIEGNRGGLDIIEGVEGNRGGIEGNRGGLPPQQYIKGI